MGPRDWMGVVIKSFGVWSGLQAMWQAGFLAQSLIKRMESDTYRPVDYCFTIAVYGVVALLLFWSADGLSYLMYPDKKTEEEPS